VLLSDGMECLAILNLALNIIAILATIAAMISAFFLVRNGDRLAIPVNEPRFDGNSGMLKATKVVPTLDAPIDRQSNVVWCASL
jgi:hypothetical protein